VVKKDWAKENFASKQEINDVEQKLSSSIEESQKTQTEKSEAAYQEFLKEVSEKQSTSEDETMKASGTIKGEPGVWKEVQVGNTLIKSNGVEVIFETTSNKNTSKESQSRESLLLKELQIRDEIIESLKTNITSNESRIAKLENDYISEQEVKAKLVKTSRLTFGTTFFIIMSLIIIGAIIIFKNTFLGWFKKLNLIR